VVSCDHVQRGVKGGFIQLHWTWVASTLALERRLAMKVVAVLIATFLSSAIAQGTNLAALELHYGREGHLSAQQQAALESITLRLLRSSNFNSERHREILKTTPRQNHAAYRKTLGGRYLVVSFETPQRIKTIGGDIVLLEIVVGLNRPDYADSLFTIDAQGRIVVHGKYSGGLCIELLNEVRKARPDA